MRLAPALVAVVAVGGSCLVSPVPAGASPQDLFGYGSRGSAMAATGVSFADDYEAVYANPAGIARVRRRGLVIGAHAAGFLVELDEERLRLDSARATSIGFQLPIPFGGILEDRLAIAAGFYTPVEVVLRGEILFPAVPQLPVLARAQSVALQAGIGLDLDGVVDGLRLGAGFSALASLIGQMVAKLDATGRFGSQVETQLVATYAPIFGASYDVGDFGLGLVWRGELRAEFSITVETADLPVTLPKLTIGGLAQYDPQTAAIEASWRPAPGWLLAANLTWRAWSDYPGPQVPTSASSSAPPAPDFSDTLSPRVAIERRLERQGPNGGTTLTFRGGFAYEPSPAPPARAEARYLDNDRLALTAGVGFSVRTGDGENAGAVFADLYGRAEMLLPRDHAAPQEGRTTPMHTEGFVLAGGWNVGVRW